jgi:hypothetical protein
VLNIENNWLFLFQLFSNITIVATEHVWNIIVMFFHSDLIGAKGLQNIL